MTFEQDAASDQHMRVGLSPLSAVLTIAADVLILFSFAYAIQQAPASPNPILLGVTWLILIAAVVTQQLTALRLHWQLPAWSFPALLATLGVVLVLDAYASWGQPELYPSAAIACGAALVIVGTAERPWALLAGGGIVGVVVVAIVLSQPHASTLRFANDILFVALAVGPPIVAAVIIRAFRSLVARELDRAQVSATAAAPHNSVGLLASEELARLDMDAENLLSEVANGSLPLPLSTERATAAAELATELRLHLIAGRNDTWLMHALRESVFLGPAVSVSDPGCFVGLLDSEQRHSLLQAIWLLLDDPGRGSAQVEISVANGTQQGPTPELLRLSLTARGVRSSKLRNDTWAALGGVGDYLETPNGVDFQVNIDCRVSNNMDYLGS